MTLWFRTPIAAAAVVFMTTPLAAACQAEDMPMPDERISAGQPLTVEDVFGLWALQPTDGEGRCRIALSNMGEGPLRGVQIESCTIKSVAGGTQWRPVEGGFELLGDGEQVLMKFRQTGIDGFESVDGRYRLSRAPMA